MREARYKVLFSRNSRRHRRCRRQIRNTVAAGPSCTKHPHTRGKQSNNNQLLNEPVSYHVSINPLNAVKSLATL